MKKEGIIEKEKRISEIASMYVKIANENNLTISEFLKSLKYAEHEAKRESHVYSSKSSLS